MTSTAPSSAKRMSMSKSPSSSPTSIMSSPRSFTPPPSGSLAGRHVIYRGLQTSSMEYMSLTHSRHPEAAHMIKGEILISGSQSGYIQYSIVLDHEWMTRKVKVSAMFSGHEKRLVLEVDQEQRWYKVTEHRQARSRSFYRSGLSLSQGSASEICSSSESSPSRSADDGSGSDSSKSHCNMQDADASLSDSSASCYSSSSDSECSIPFEKINLTWTPPPKGTKRASKRFSSMNLLGKISANAAAASPSEPTLNTSSHDTQSASPLTPSSSFTSSPSSPSSQTPSIPMTASPSATITTASQQQSPALCFASSKLTRTFSSSSQSGLKKYEHLAHLDGCTQLDLGYETSPSTLLFPLRRATLGVDSEKMRDHLESLSVDGASTTEKTALISFPDLELKPVQQHLAFAGPGRRPNDSLVECWQDDEDESMLIEVDGDGFVIRDGYNWARIPSS
ncbi:hypothetical protein BG015_006721 [Linnemannia schmuckeri]|uniref:Uncharacterized protein n=1 Tax=Linnemannia schmuckeri TaxID=64567 RepID=A0A9P5RZU1_9FUNG|nr:hypothetical protein BG015_006721 [Linnemannia schmuckeri]